ncbi:MAG TPA: cyclic nucleotide-binding domain-containing protein [Polyangiaceae bacterium]|jgi:serine/threonine protein phosphatase PrpC|nr:cyclic nucleotide-binding domain-containing protein [Polyangiaceae bacterium]
MKLSDSIRFYAATDVGKVRDHNEDNFLVDKKLALFVVADGMGGHAAGEVASAIAVRTLHEEIRREKDLLDDYAQGGTGAVKVTRKDVVAVVEQAVQRACSKIHQEALVDPQKRGMGTTLSALLVVGDQGFIGHVGDSRIYLARGGRPQQVTEDHTVYNELIKRGKLTREQIDKVQQKNAITRAVGVYERVEVDTLVVELIAGDTLVLASDGLHGYLESPDELREALSLEGDASAKALIDLANARGGKDNITTIVVRVGEEGAASAVQAKRLAQKRDVIAKTPLFARLSDRELLRVMQAVQVRSCKDGEVVIREGDKGDELFIVLEGQVRVSRGDQTLTHFGPGEHFGEMALIRSVPRSATVTAVGPAELVVIRRADFFEILRKEHEVAVKMLWQFLGVLADRLDHTSSELHEMKRELAAEDMTQEIFPEADAEPVDAPVLSR